jgi:hypothetical protein
VSRAGDGLQCEVEGGPNKWALLVSEGKGADGIPIWVSSWVGHGPDLARAGSVPPRPSSSFLF